MSLARARALSIAAIIRCGSGTFSGPAEEGGFLFRLTIGLRNIEVTGASRTNITPYRRRIKFVTIGLLESARVG
jgi:hypothetical protein